MPWVKPMTSHAWLYSDTFQQLTREYSGYQWLMSPLPPSVDYKYKMGYQLLPIGNNKYLPHSRDLDLTITLILVFWFLSMSRTKKNV